MYELNGIEEHLKTLAESCIVAAREANRRALEAMTEAMPDFSSLDIWPIDESLLTLSPSNMIFGYSLDPDCEEPREITGFRPVR